MPITQDLETTPERTSGPAETTETARSTDPPVTPVEMRAIFEEVRTPYKFGIVLKGEAGLDAGMLDHPVVFSHDGQWYLTYTCQNGVGCETFLATSTDLLTWNKLGRILSHRRTGWDAWQAGGAPALVENEWGGGYRLQMYERRWWMSYHGYDRQGETAGPLSIGMTSTNSPGSPREWRRLAEGPVIRPDQPVERETIHRGYVLWDRDHSLGYPFVMLYDGRIGDAPAPIGLAVSHDLRRWERLDSEAAPAVSDPQIARVGGLWVMFHSAHRKPVACATFACSRDLLRWTTWNGPALAEPSRPWDGITAHRPCVIRHEGIVYHFYAAAGNQGRVIALATSRDLLTA